MKVWAKKFYNSKAWRECRKSYLVSVQNICERCEKIAKIVHHKIHITPENISDPYITLSHDNLEAVCQDCHNAEHNPSPKTRHRYSFDAHGNIIYPPHLDSADSAAQTASED